MVKMRPPSAGTERLGVHEVGVLVNRDLEWIFREQPTDDFGIDAQIEVVHHGAVTGKLIAAQIKSGPSYFIKTTGGWWFYPRQDDLDYWLDHSLPVIVVCYEPATDSAYWESVGPETLKKTTGTGMKILIPETKRLGVNSSEELRKLASGTPYDLRIRELRLALPWMRLLLDGTRILLEAEEWINKTSGRGDISIVAVDDVTGDKQELGTWTLWAGLAPYDRVLPTLVPWADVILHEETYEEADHEAWEEECVRYYGGGIRIEDFPFDDWRTQFDGAGLRPYRNGAGEVDFWRLELVLNDLGRSFVRVDTFAESGKPLLHPNR